MARTLEPLEPRKPKAKPTKKEVKKIAKKIIKQHAGTLKKLAADEAKEKHGSTGSVRRDHEVPPRDVAAAVPGPAVPRPAAGGRRDGGAQRLPPAGGADPHGAAGGRGVPAGVPVRSRNGVTYPVVFLPTTDVGEDGLRHLIEVT